MRTKIELLELENYAGEHTNFECVVSFKDLLELIEDIYFIKHLYNIVTDEDYGYNDKIKFVEQFDEYLGRGECTLYRSDASWDAELLDRDHMVGDFATFEVGENSFVLRLEELDVALRDYEENITFLHDKYEELIA